MNELICKIQELKKKKNAIILAHSYQNIEIDKVADYVGDSLYLSRMAAKTSADIIVFAGVYFMAQTAKILCPDKKVLLPDLKAGCEMADMINLQQLREFKIKHPDIPTVCYINSTAEVKSECDICCTSSNAVKIVESLHAQKVLFVPDQNLGKWVEKRLRNIEVITYSGYCPIHHNITVDDACKVKEKYPDIKLLAHPECKEEVSVLADYVGSTTGIMDYVKNSSDSKFIIATEKGVVDRLKRDYPDKEFIIIKENLICESMKLNTLQDIYDSLNNETFEIDVDPTISKQAHKCIDRMLEVSNTGVK